MKFAISLSVAGALALGASPAFADSGSLASSAPVTVDVNPFSDAQALARLEALAQTQTAADIAAIVNTGLPNVSLRNGAGDIIAVYLPSPGITPLLSQRGPGCAAGDACALANGGSTPFGFYGTGLLSVGIPNVTRISAGSNTTTFWYGGSGDFVSAGSTAFVPNRYYTRVTRS
ncbi:hypothetical protein ABCS02_13265 [Microbacterium sp. X-17]|uniref:hypothetical protein n=1 Tax=Microbacterium sp. X-17 TaxID=3144404 RepID=UPI0031F5588E